MRAEGSGRKRRLTPGGLAKAALAALLGLYLAWWVVKIDAVGAEIDDNPLIAATVAPDHPRVRIDLAMLYFMAQGGRVPEERHAAALAAVRQAPLADEPFVLAGVDALARGDAARGERLLEEARRRNPRLRLAHVLLLDRYLREHRVREAVLEMKALGNLMTGVSTLLTPVLAHMAQDPATAPQMLPLLRAQPGLHESVLESLVGSGASEAEVLNVAGPAARSRGSEPWKAALLSRLVDKRDFGAAWDLWKSFAGYQGDAKGLYDGRFAGLPGPAPFNWELSSGGPGVAERGRSPGLQVDYYGRDNGNLASQLLMLRPGRYRLSFRASGDALGDSSRLIWTIACNPGDARLLQLPVTGVASEPRKFTADFTVPANGCPSQWLRLVGFSGDVVSAQEATIADLDIEAEAGA